MKNEFNKKEIGFIWNWYIDSMKEEGYTREEIMDIHRKSLSYPSLKTKSKRLSKNYRTAFYVGIMTGILSCDDSFNEFVQSGERNTQNERK